MGEDQHSAVDHRHDHDHRRRSFSVLRAPRTAGGRSPIGAVFGIVFSLCQQITRHLTLLLDLNPAVTALAPSLMLMSLAVICFNGCTASAGMTPGMREARAGADAARAGSQTQDRPTQAEADDLEPKIERAAVRPGRRRRCPGSGNWRTSAPIGEPPARSLAVAPADATGLLGLRCQNGRQGRWKSAPAPATSDWTRAYGRCRRSASGWRPTRPALAAGGSSAASAGDFLPQPQKANSSRCPHRRRPERHDRRRLKATTPQTQPPNCRLSASANPT